MTYLYGLLTHPVVGPHVRFRGSTLSPQEFAEAFYDGLLVAHVARSRSSGRPLGVLMLHQASLIDGYAHLSVVAEPSRVGTGLMAEAAMAFLSYAFDTWPLRKVYVEAGDNTFRQYRSIVRRFGTQEGTLRAHAFADGEFQDVRIVAIYREAFKEYLTTALSGLVEPC